METYYNILQHICAALHHPRALPRPLCQNLSTNQMMSVCVVWTKIGMGLENPIICDNKISPHVGQEHPLQLCCPFPFSWFWCFCLVQKVSCVIANCVQV